MWEEFWFFRGDKSGRSSAVSRPLIFHNCSMDIGQLGIIREPFWVVNNLYFFKFLYILYIICIFIYFLYLEPVHPFIVITFAQVQMFFGMGFLMVFVCVWWFVCIWIFCQVSEQSEQKLPAETRQQPNDGTAAAASKVAPCGGMWVELDREMQTFWFFRGDRAGRSSNVSCPLVLQWTLDNYGTILIHEYFEHVASFCLLTSFSFFFLLLHSFTIF